MCNIRSNSHAAFDSDLPAGFPATVGACQTTNDGGNDAFVSKQNATGSMLLYSTYLGGTNPDTGTAIAVDSAGNAYVTGSTESIDFPTTANAIQPISGGPNAFGTGDAFVTVLNPQGDGLVYSSYFGGSDNDVGAGIALDTSFSAYVTGSTASTNFPTTQQCLSDHLRRRPLRRLRRRRSPASFARRKRTTTIAMITTVMGNETITSVIMTHIKLNPTPAKVMTRWSLRNGTARKSESP